MRKQLYATWRSMKARCYNPNHKKYHRYGGRGIRVCDEWRNDSQRFIQYWLSNGWKPGLQIDRIDNDGDYCPENCQLLTNRENTLKANNYGLRCDNKTGYRGVRWHSKQQRYETNITIYGRYISIGYYDDLLDAVRAWNDFVINNNLEHEYNLQIEPRETEGNELFKMLRNL